MQLSGLQFSPTSISDRATKQPRGYILGGDQLGPGVLAGRSRKRGVSGGAQGLWRTWRGGWSASLSRAGGVRLIKAAPWCASGSTPARLLVQ